MSVELWSCTRPPTEAASSLELRLWRLRNRETCKRRNVIERTFNKLKNWRRITSRHDKSVSSFLAFIMLDPAKRWMSFVHGT
jgi:transposase